MTSSSEFRFVDLDSIESSALACLETGSGLIDPQTVLELVRLLRASNKAVGAGVMVVTSGEATDPVGGFPHKFAANVSRLMEGEPLNLEFTEETPCNCDQTLELQKRVAELELRVKEIETQLTYASADFLAARSAVGSAWFSRPGVTLAEAIAAKTSFLERAGAWQDPADCPFGVYVWALYEPIRGRLEPKRLRRNARGAITWSSEGEWFICAERLIRGWLPESALPPVQPTETSNA